MARDQVFDRHVALALKGAEAEVQKRFVAEIHKQVGRVYREAHPSGHKQWIDGTEGAAIEKVAPFGVAHFQFRYLPEILVFAGNILFANSPVDMHRRRDNIVFRDWRLAFVNGSQIGEVWDGTTESDYPWALEIPYGTEVVITDDEPYAGKLERGHSDQAPNGVYKISCDTVRRKFGNLVTVKYQWVRIEGERMSPAMVIAER